MRAACCAQQAGLHACRRGMQQFANCFRMRTHPIYSDGTLVSLTVEEHNFEVYPATQGWMNETEEERKEGMITAVPTA